MAATKVFIEAIVSNFELLTLEDPLIAWKLRNLARISSIIFFISLVLTVVIIGRKTKVVLALTIVVTTLIFFLLMLTGVNYDVYDAALE